MHCSDPSVVCDWPDVGDGDSGGDYDDMDYDDVVVLG